MTRHRPGATRAPVVLVALRRPVEARAAASALSGCGVALAKTDMV